MQVVAFCTPTRPEWRWRIVDLEGALVEESRDTFGSIANALVDGTRRKGELAVRDLAERSQRFTGRPAYLRNR